jgi:hypothetical protein
LRNGAYGTCLASQERLAEAVGGALTLIQRFGSAANLNTSWRWNRSSDRQHVDARSLEFPCERRGPVDHLSADWEGVHRGLVRGVALPRGARGRPAAARCGAASSLTSSVRPGDATGADAAGARRRLSSAR